MAKQNPQNPVNAATANAGENKNSTTSITTTLPLHGVHGEIYKEPAILSSANISFTCFQQLDDELALVLFTPAIPSSIDEDPFEPFGRAIQANHPHVRHVPYSPSDGFTYVHEAHLRRVDVVAAVVVVVGNETVEEQMKFAQKAKNVLDGEMPAVLIWIGHGLNGADLGFELVLQCMDVTRTLLIGVARSIFLLKFWTTFKMGAVRRDTNGGLCGIPQTIRKYKTHNGMIGKGMSKLHFGYQDIYSYPVHRTYLILLSSVVIPFSSCLCL